MLTNKKIVLIGNCGRTETSSGKCDARTNSAWHALDCTKATNITSGFHISGGEASKSSPSPTDFHSSFAPALFDFDRLSKYTSFGRSRIYKLIADGEFPPPVKIGKSSRWLKTEIDCWLSKQAAARHQLVTE